MSRLQKPIFRINVFFLLKHGFRMFLVNKFHNNLFHCAGCVSFKSKSMTTFDIHTKSLQTFKIFSSRYWSEIWFKTPDILMLLWHPYFSFFDSCFSRLTILYSKILFMFFTTVHWWVFHWYSQDFERYLKDLQFHYIFARSCYQQLLYPLFFLYSQQDLSSWSH